MKLARSLFFTALTIAAAFAEADLTIPADAIRYEESIGQLTVTDGACVIGATVDELTAYGSQIFIKPGAVIKKASFTSTEVYVFKGASLVVDSAYGSNFYLEAGSELSFDLLVGATVHYDQDFGAPPPGTWMYAVNANWVYDAEAEEYVYIPTTWRWSQSRGWYQP